jgi:hypothetical protein
MSQSMMESAIPHQDEMSLDGQRIDVLVRLWDEAEQSIATQRLSPPMPRHTHPEAQAAHVRYAFD